MKLNIGNNNNDKIDSLKKNIENEKNEEKKNQEVRQAIRNSLYSEAVEVQVTEEDVVRQQKQAFFIKFRKIIFLILICIFLVVLSVVAVKKTFFSNGYTPQQIADIAMTYSGNTAFPEDGVEGYLNRNISNLMNQAISIDKNTTGLEILNPKVTRIVKKSNSIANIYFYVDLKTNNGTNRVDCILPLSYNNDSKTYAPAGTVMITPNVQNNESTKVEDNEFLSFSDVAKYTDDKSKAVESFVSNFFTILYSGKDITPYYNGAYKLTSKGLEFVSMTSFVYYQDTNKNGYNAIATIQLKTEAGVNYTTVKYLKIESQGNTWIISGIL